MVRLLKPSVTPSKRAVIDWLRVHNRFSGIRELIMIKLSDLKEVMVQRIRMVCRSIKRILNMLRPEYLHKKYDHPDP